MIQIEEIVIKNFRGIRDLKLEPKRKSFGIQGPNGSGKSGVVDAIEFCLTGDIRRLTGMGTGKITARQHGPHVDATDDLASASVSLTVYLPTINKSTTVTRTLKKPKKPTIQPSSPEIEAVLNELSQHPELALSRREIIKFILSAATKRSDDVQILLRLDRISKVRSVLKTARNKTASLSKAVKQTVAERERSLRSHLDIVSLEDELVLDSINSRRLKLNLDSLKEISSETSVKNGLEDRKSSTNKIAKQTAINDLKSLKQSLKDDSINDAIHQVQEQLGALDQNPHLMIAARQRQLVASGLDLLDQDQCPLCDSAWNLEELKTHLNKKLDLSKEADSVLSKINSAAAIISSAFKAIVTRANTVLDNMKRIGDTESASNVLPWVVELEQAIKQLRNVDGIISIRGDLAQDCFQPPESAKESLRNHVDVVKQLPEQTAINAAHTFLVIADERLNELRDARQAATKAEAAAKMGATAYSSYCDSAESILESLYQDVEKQFIESYRLINPDDEDGFTAKLTPTEGQLDLTVDFHKRGQYPPAAYHSEGHQDGMGLCLYLALMKQVFGENFSLAVLDDVVMSVDRQHRKKVCDLLNQAFPETQFIITTHEQAWFKQMQQVKLIKSGAKFTRWSVEDGPVKSDAAGTWEDIESALENDDIPEAAFRLRNHLEFVAPDLVEELGGFVQLRGAGDYNGGELMKSAISRFGDLLKMAGNSAREWKNEEAESALKELEAEFKACKKQKSVEDWAINSVVHYNDWAELSKQDFIAVVDAFKALLNCFRCKVCQAWLFATPRRCFKGQEESLRCNCGKRIFNLTKPSGDQKKQLKLDLAAKQLAK